MKIKKVDTTGIIDGINKTTSSVIKSTNAISKKTQDVVINAIDENGNGEIDIEDIIIKGIKIPGIKINRSDFLKNELKNKFTKESIDDAIEHNPMHAKMPTATIDKIADAVIKYERNFVSGISATLATPGGFTMAATIPADIIQYYGYMLRATQKLLYLYGFPEIEINENSNVLDSETMNILILCLGVMYGSANANNAIKVISKALATGVEKKLLNTALTKGTIYPIVKEVAKWFGKKMTKDVFAGFFKNSIPLLGGVIGGTVTFFSFEASCKMLKNSLKDTLLSNPNFIDTNIENIVSV